MFLWYNQAMKTRKNEQLNSEEVVTVLKSEYEKLKKELEEVKALNTWYEEQLKIIKKRKYGSESEYACDEVIGQLCMFDEAEAIAYIEEIKKKSTTVKEHERTVKKEAVLRPLMESLPDNIPVEVEEHHLVGDDLLCPVCGEEMEIIGKDTRETLKIIPAQVIVRRDVYYRYKCKACEKESDESLIVKTPRDTSVYPGSYASPEAIAYLMTEKYVMGSPLYRMEAEFNRQGIPLSRQTMSNWVIYAANHWLKPIFEELHRRLLKQDIIHADETTLKVISVKDRQKCYIWLYRTGKFAEHPIVLYEFAESRANDYPAAFLKGFKGYLNVDGYDAYETLRDLSALESENHEPQITLVKCLAHIKRKFHEAVEVLPKDKRTGAAVEGEAFCVELFRIEEMLTGFSPEERYEQRLKLAKPVLDAFLAWALKKNASPKSKLGKALTYLKNQGSSMANYLLDGRLEISNNLAERSIKPFVIDRKNFLFANTTNGAYASTTTFSIIETAKENGLDPYKYLVYIFKKAPTLNQNEVDWILPLLPENAPDDCKAMNPTGS